MTRPVVSFIIPTRDCARHLRACLASIQALAPGQPPHEVLVIDGGSTDDTVAVAEAAGARVLRNERRVAYNQEGPEGSKAIGVRAAEGEFLAFVDADNALATADWVERMLEPFRDHPEVAVVEPSKWARPGDSAVNRYCSSLVTRTDRADPFSLGSPVRDAWVERVPGERYALWRAHGLRMPCIANGTVVRRSAVLAAGGYDYDADLTRRIVEGGAATVATVRSTGVYHDYVPSMRVLFRKARWRSAYAARLVETKERAAPAELSSRSLGEVARNAAWSLTLVGPAVYATRRALRDRDAAWLLHPWVCALVTGVFAVNVLPRLPAILGAVGARRTGG